jgi:dipeptidyl aminopeptidase/acylaminoacyl peptidase
MPVRIPSLILAHLLIVALTCPPLLTAANASPPAHQVDHGSQSSAEKKAFNKSLTFSTALTFKMARLVDLRWLPSGLIGEYSSTGGSTVVRQWFLTGGSRDLAMGSSSISPSLRWVVHSRPDSLTITDRHAAGFSHRAFHIRADFNASISSAQPVWSETGAYLAFAEDRHDMDNSGPAIQDPNVEDVGRFAELSERIPRSFISIIDVRTHKNVAHVGIDGQVAALQWSGREKLYITIRGAWSLSGENPETRIYEYRPENHQRRLVFSIGGIQQTIVPKVSPDGHWMAFAADVDDQKWDDFVSLVLLDLRTLSIRRLTKNLAVGGSLAWDRQSDGLYFTVRDGGWTQIWRTDLNGRTTQLSSSPNIKSNVRLSPYSNDLAYVERSGDGRVRLRILNLESGQSRSLAIICDPTKDFKLGAFQQVRFPSKDGIKIAAFLVLPPNFRPDRRYPLIVDVHGGGPGAPLALEAPLNAVSPSPLEWHAWATLGFVVLIPDYRSSGAYGPGIASARYKNADYNGIEADAEDVESATKWGSALPYVDSRRVAVRGTSAGGARVNRLLMRSRIYSAAVLVEPTSSGIVAELLGATTGDQAGTTLWRRYFADQLNGDLSENPNRYKDGFLFDGYKNRTPTLLLYGAQQNGGVSPLSGEVLFSTLRTYGVPARMLRYKNEGHAFTHYHSALAALNENLAWFDYYLKIDRPR